MLSEVSWLTSPGIGIASKMRFRRFNMIMYFQRGGAISAGEMVEARELLNHLHLIKFVATESAVKLLDL